MTDQLAEQRKRAGIRDYMATLRRRKWVILGTTVVAALAAAALSVTQPKTYQAQATLQALDPAQSAGYADLQQADVNIATVTSAQLAQTATRTDVITAVKARLGLSDSLDQIRSKLSLSEDPQSNFVLLTATGKTPDAAVALADTTAGELASISNSQERTIFAQRAAQESSSIASLLSQFAGKSYGQLSPADQARFQANQSQANQLSSLAARLTAFSKVVTIAQVEANATTPTSPSSPHPASTAVLGGVVGLILGLLLAWFLESLDRRLRRPDEAESVLGMPIVGAVPKGQLGQRPASGKDALSLAAFRMVHTNVRFLASGSGAAPRSMLVTSALSEEGKTTVAIGIAMSAAVAGVKTLLIEADVHRPTHAKRLGLNPGPGLGDYLQGGYSPGQILQVHRFVDPANTPTNGSSARGGLAELTCITAGNVKSFPAVKLGAEHFGAVVREVGRVYDLVVIDTAPLLAVPETLEMMTFTDSAVFCARLGRTTVEQARSARESLSRLDKTIGLVLTDLDPDLGGYYGYTYAYDYTASHAAAGKS